MEKIFDRTFFNGHAPVLKDKWIGFIISGPLSHRQNLRETLDVLAETWYTKPVGVVTDEHETEAGITRHLEGLVQRLDLARKNRLSFGPKFYHAGGQKIFEGFYFQYIRRVPGR